jgi:dTDP-4-dehydrorhamnose 3,5-epimerase
MKFTETKLQGAFILELEHRSDNRGFFARTFCQKEFEAHGLNPNVAQSNLSFNEKAGTLRGLHYQTPPAIEAKLFRCIKGAIYDVIVDMRPDSPTYLQHFGIELSADNHLALYVPEMFAHGYQALQDGTEVLYQVSEFYTPGVEKGLRYDDPALGINWPMPATVVSEKDLSWPLLAPVSVGA